ncbi:hydrogenase expression/formation protein [Wenzhouxiangella sp. XN24]|uniref:hydrogenase expression/formation protein n=1 Tax=Wenzhouxiangella sp. XN24 TaxID=2713569 RepID=UPI0013EAEF70|nr:hydrogenase expression/formation protein [Wenzhouxiangella sp. XN24]NGX15388.1 hydrogenase expression/formation protein [Wenzhouxiangella sp. XN24]
MSGLSEIGVKVESEGPSEPELRGNTLPLLHEIRHALGRLVESGEPTVIDVQSLPMGPGDMDRLMGALGDGEVRAELEALGTTVIRESRYSGVWIIEHMNGSGGVASRFIEISWVPDLLQAQAEDVQKGLTELVDALASAGN